MARRINTDLGLNVNLTDAPDIKAVAVTNTPLPTGKNDFEVLSDVLTQFNPKIQELVRKNVQERDKQEEILGANTVNGITLEEARKAHEQGFPDIYNGWARAGAYKQYALNATAEFSARMKQRYDQNKNNPEYNWQQDYAEQSQQYLVGKENDPFFQAAFQQISPLTQKYITEQEFTNQTENLKIRVSNSTMYELRTLSDKVLDTLNANFRETIPIETSGKDFDQRKQEYISQNYIKLWNEEFENIKNNLNPVLSKVDFDALVIDTAESHLKLGGDYISLYVDKLIKPRPDGTPPVLDNPKFNTKVLAIVSKANESLKTLQFYEQLKAGNTSTISNEDYKKYSESLFGNLVNKHLSNGETQGQAIQSAATTLSPFLSKARPIPQIKEILGRPVGTIVTPDNRAALDLAMVLDNAGALPMYFDNAENSRDAVKWQLATMFYRNGEDPSTVIRKIGNFEQNSKTSPLNERDKKDLGGKFVNLQTIHNQSLVYGIAQYIKSTDGSAGLSLAANTKKYINDYYFLDEGGKYISKSKLTMLGISSDEYKPLKDEAQLYLKEEINNLLKSGSVKLSSAEELKETGKVKGFRNIVKEKQKENIKILEDTNFREGNYDFVINPDTRKIMFVKDNQVGIFEPVIINIKGGDRVQLEFDYDTLYKRYKGKQEINKATKQMQLFKKEEILNKYNETYKEFLKTSP